jgi:predicted RNase H-like HicB family nuclease
MIGREREGREQVTYTVRVHDEGEHGLWAEIEELPGCHASGFSATELREAILEAISVYLSDDNLTVVASSPRPPADRVEILDVELARVS